MFVLILLLSLCFVGINLLPLIDFSESFESLVWLMFTFIIISYGLGLTSLGVALFVVTKSIVIVKASRK